MNKKIPEKINLDEVVEFVKKHSSATRLYLGCDSEKHKINGVWYADYVSVIVVHIDGSRGCKIFGCMQREKDFEPNKKKPRIRLMTEVRKVAELYLEVFDKFIEMPEIAENLSVHLDINRFPEHGSSVVLEEAIGYIKAMCGIVPEVKDVAWAASYCADRYTEIVNLKPAMPFEREYKKENHKVLW